MRLATLTLTDARLPLSEADRATLIAGLRDILSQYEEGGAHMERVCLHLIHTPEKPRPPIHSGDCGR